MADRYWVGGSGTWDATTTTNWSATSGGVGGASSPTLADNVIFNSLSNATLYTVTVGTNAVCNDMTAAGPLTGNVTFSLGATAVINCYGSFLLPASGATWTGTAGCNITFRATTTGKTITTNGVTLTGTSVFLNGVGGTWTLGSNLTTGAPNQVVSVQSGTFNTNDYFITSGGLINNTVGTQVINLGSSVCTFNGGTPVNFLQTAGLTFNAGASSIVCSGGTQTLTGGGQTFYDVSFTFAGTGTSTINDANTFRDLNQTSRSATGVRVVTLGANQTVTGTLTLGTANQSIRRILVQSDVIGTQRTITLNGTLATLADCDFRDIATAGSAGTWTGTRIGNGLNNSGITFDAAKTVYWSFNAGGSFIGTAWALTSGGTPNANNFPLAQDKIIIENTGLNSSATVSFSTAAYWFGELDLSTRTLPMTLTNGAVNAVFYKNVTLSSALTMTGTSAWLFQGQGTTQILDVNTATFVPPITIDSPSGTLQLAENTTCSGLVTLTSGTLNLNNNTLACDRFSSTNTNTRTVAFGTGQINLTGNAATIWTTATGTNLTVTGTPTVNATYSGSTGTRTIQSQLAAITTNLFNFNITAGSDTLTIGSARNVNSLNFTGFSGIISTFATTNLGVYGDLTFSPTMTFATFGTGGFSLANTTVNQQITGNNLTVESGVSINGLNVQLQDNLTLGSTRNFTLNTGTLDLNNRTLSTGLFTSSNSNTRSIAFGTGNITVTGSGTTIWNTATATNFSYTGTSNVNFTYSGSTGTRTIAQAGLANGGTEFNALNMNISAGSDTITFGGANRIYRNLDFTGFTGTYTNAQVIFVGDLKFSSGMTVGSGSAIVTFDGTTGTKLITTAGQTIDFPITFNGIGATFAFQDALTMGSTRTLTLNAGSLLFKSGTTNTVGNIVLAGNSADTTRLSSTDQGFAAFLQKVIGGNVTASNMIIENSSVTPANTWFGDLTTVDGGGNTNWTFAQTEVRGHDAFLPQEIQKFKELDRKARLAEANRVRAAKLVSYHRKRRFTELLAPELINPQEESFYEQLREQQFPEEVAKEKAEQAEQEATAEAKAKVEAKKREIKKELKRLQKEEKDAAAKVVELQRQKELLIDTVIARQKETEIQVQLAIIYKLQQEEMEDEAALLLLI